MRRNLRIRACHYGDRETVTIHSRVCIAFIPEMTVIALSVALDTSHHTMLSNAD
jgi:hypothetical protein